jgi:hypothetical protein
MSMSSDSENFEQLRRLVALKRHEQPPPGYFHHFSREVIVRIKAGETGDQITASWWSWNSSLLQRFWAAIESRPALAGAFGVAVCGFFAAGALLSENANSAVAGSDHSSDPILLGSINSPQASAPWSTAHAVSFGSSGVVPEIQAANSLFDFQRQQAAQAFNVNFVPGN